MDLRAGTKLGPYEIQSPLGAGGMGEVYRARDTRLKRDVALKVLLEGVAGDADRLARFQREAEVLATLNHPNIAAIYGLEGAALVLELVDGPTLAARIAQGPVSFNDALPILDQIIDALEYAHEKGVVHRDLKPANIKITPSGSVKLLDFGLAKALGNEVLSGDPQSSPTIISATMPGMILGTAQYMAPEQARGLAVDKRTDIWAFGVITYEMLTGKPPFAAPTVTDTLALVITKDPDFTVVPERARPLLQRCLERDPRKRLRDIGDARMLLEDIAPSAQRVSASKHLSITLAAIALLSLIVAGSLALLHFQEQPTPTHPVRFEIPGEAGSSRYNPMCVSHDGRYIAFVGLNSDTLRVLRIRALDSLQTRTVPESEGINVAVSWSPDSKFLLFIVGTRLKKAAATGGPTETLADLGSRFSAIAWTHDGWIILVGDEMIRMRESGGNPTTIAQKLPRIMDFHFLPDERHFLFSVGDPSVPGTALGIFAGALDDVQSLGSQVKSGNPLAIADVGHFAFVPAREKNRGYLLFARDGAIVAQALDTEKLELAGPPVTIATGVFEVGASEEVLAYRTGSSQENQLRWFDRHGKLLGSMGEVGNTGDVWISRDGKTVMIDRIDGRTNHVWLGDIGRGVFSRLTSSTTNETAGALGPDGTVVFTVSTPAGAGDLYSLRPNNSSPELLVQSEFLKHPNDVSPDGKYLMFDVHGKQQQDLYVLSLDTPGAKPVPFVVTPADETFGQFSPDGKWVAYASNESGRREVYVRAFLPGQDPAAGARKWLVSTAGGNKPRWSHDGKELYYISLDGKMMATPVKTGSTFDPAIPVSLFDVRYDGFFPYDVSPDGRFLIDTPVTENLTNATSITVILDWAAALTH